MKEMFSSPLTGMGKRALTAFVAALLLSSTGIVRGQDAESLLYEGAPDQQDSKLEGTVDSRSETRQVEDAEDRATADRVGGLPLELYSEQQVTAGSSSPANSDDAALTGAQDSDVEAEDSTVVYEAGYFADYNPISVNDMLDRIPGLDLGGNRGGGGRGLGTGGNLLIDGQRIAGKGNSARDQLDRIAADNVDKIEIIRNTSGSLNVRGAGQVVNIILREGSSSSSTTAEAIARHNRDGTVEAGANLAHSRQVGNLQMLMNLQSRPNYEYRDTWEDRISPDGSVLTTLRENNVRDQDNYEFSTNMSYMNGPHRIQLNTLLGDRSHPRPVRRDFIDFIDGEALGRTETEEVDNTQTNWEVGGEYEFTFDNNSRLQMLLLANEEVRDNVRERFATESGDPIGELDKVLFIDSNRTTQELIAQGNYSFSLTDSQSLRVGLERADTRLDSSLFLGSRSGSETPSDRTGGLPPLTSQFNPGTEVQEIRYEGFAFHNWTLNDRMSLESSLVYETSEISQSGQTDKTRDFQFWRPSVDFRFNITDNFQFRASAERSISQLSFSNFAATANNDDRDQDTNAGNPELVPEQRWRYETEVEFRLPDDAGVLNARLFYDDIEDYIGRINATRDPETPLSATGNVGPAKRWGLRASASSRLVYFGMRDAIISADLGVFDSEIIDPFLGTEQRIGGRGFSSINFRHDITDLGLTYGMEYRYPFIGGQYEIDINTITRNDGQPSLDLFVSKVFFDDFLVRLDSDNTLDDSSCRIRQRFNGTTIDGDLRWTEDSCSTRYRRLTLSLQTTF
ncbi:MAG: TonB-dependent receptor [Gammaproteobacteria bacterium]|nr:TonB-dependent receptor [Gammaproteobacteria bacterium]